MSTGIKKQLAICNSFVRQAKDARESIHAEGRTDEWTRKELHNLENKFSDMAAEIKSNIMEVAKDELSTQVDKAKRLRNRPGNNIKPTDSAAKLYRLEIARMAMAGLSEEEAIEKYPDLVQDLADHEMEHLHVYEDALLAHVKVNRALAQDVIFKNLPPERKVAEVGVMKLRNQIETAEMLVNNFEYDLKNIISGKADIPSYDYVELLDEAPKKLAADSEPIKQALEGTPYNGGMHDHK